MSAGPAANSGTTAVREGYEIDLAALNQWMRANVPDYAGPLSARQFRGGQSNPTYKLTTPHRAYVLRKKPPGALLKGAHAVEREARVRGALGANGFPVAHIHGLCLDDDVVGTNFYVMDMVEGRLFWDAGFSDVPIADRAAYFDAMIVAGLGGVDPLALGLPSEADYIAAYCRRTGRAGIDHYDFYVAFNMFRLAAIFHGIKGRVLRGTAASVQAERRAANLPELSALPWEQAVRGRAMNMGDRQKFLGR